MSRLPAPRTQQELIPVSAGRVTLSDRRTRRTWAIEVAPYRPAS